MFVTHTNDGQRITELNYLRFILNNDYPSAVCSCLVSFLSTTILHGHVCDITLTVAETKLYNYNTFRQTITVKEMHVLAILPFWLFGKCLTGKHTIKTLVIVKPITSNDCVDRFALSLR